jgi:hypothetical protein
MPGMLGSYRLDRVSSKDRPCHINSCGRSIIPRDGWGGNLGSMGRIGRMFTFVSWQRYRSV